LAIRFAPFLESILPFATRLREDVVYGALTQVLNFFE